MFFSWTACWRNRGAFFTYALLFAVLMVAIPFFPEAVFSLRRRDGAVLPVTPYSLLMLAILYCFFYATYRGCFNVPPAEAPRPDTRREDRRRRSCPSAASPLNH